MTEEFTGPLAGLITKRHPCHRPAKWPRPGRGEHNVSERHHPDRGRVPRETNHPRRAGLGGMWGGHGASTEPRARHLDRAPRTLDALDVKTLKDLAAIVMNDLELRRESRFCEWSANALGWRRRDARSGRHTSAPSPRRDHDLRVVPSSLLRGVRRHLAQAV